MFGSNSSHCPKLENSSPAPLLNNHLSKFCSKKWLLERMNEFSGSIRRKNFECYYTPLTSLSIQLKQTWEKRKKVSIQKQVAGTLWRLLFENSRRFVPKVFGVERSTVSQIMKEFCKTLRKKSSCFIKFPKPKMGVALEIQKFQDDCKIPTTAGAIKWNK